MIVSQSEQHPQNQQPQQHQRRVRNLHLHLHAQVAQIRAAQVQVAQAMCSSVQRLMSITQDALDDAPVVVEDQHHVDRRCNPGG